MLHRSFKPAKCKTALKLAVSRIKLLKNKRTQNMVQLRREVAQLLASGQERTARIRVEHVLREEKTMAAYDLLEVYLELIVARLAMIESQKNCPIDLKEAVTSVIFASPRCADLPELQDIRKHLQSKYGKEFSTAAIELRPDCGVSRLMIEKLSVAAPDAQTKTKILSAIALEHNINWDPKESGENEEKHPEDLLNGPDTFLKASQKYEESPVQAPTINTQKHDEYRHENPSSPPVTQNFGSSATPSAYQSQPGTPSMTAEEMGHRYTYSGDQKTYAAGKQHWNMEFTDATSAAQAAAEAAERASMAARAAAELSSGERILRQQSYESQRPSVNNLRNASIDKHTVPTTSNANVSKDPEKELQHGRGSGMETDKPSTKNYLQPHPRPDAAYQNEGLETVSGKSKIPPDHIVRNDAKRTNSKLDSSQGSDDFSKNSKRNSHDDLTVQGTNANEQGNRIEVNEQLNRPVHIRGSSRSESLKSKASFQEEDVFVNSYSQENIFYNSDQAVEHENNFAGEAGWEMGSSHYKNTEADDINCFADEIMDEKPNSGTSRSQSTKSEGDHDDLLSDQFDNLEHSKFHSHTNEHETAVFDSFGSDDDLDQKIDLTGGFKGDDHDPLKSPDQRSQIYESPKRSSWFASDTSYNGLPFKSIFADDESSSTKLFNNQSDIVGSSHSHESLPVAFDESDSEVELNGSDHGVSSTHESLSRHSGGNAGSGNCECITTFPVLDDDELQHNFSTHSVVSDKESKPKKESPYTSGGETSIEQPSLNTGKELNLGLLSGGFRNKGKKNPPYIKSPSYAPSLLADEILENDTSLSQTRTSAVFENAAKQRPSGLQPSVRTEKKSSPKLKVQHYDLDEDSSHSEDEPSQISIKRSPERRNQNAPSVSSHKSSFNSRLTYSDSDKLLNEEATAVQNSLSKSDIGSSSDAYKSGVSSRPTYPDDDNLPNDEGAPVRVSRPKPHLGSGLSRRTKTSTPSRETYSTSSLSVKETQTTHLEEQSEAPRLTRPIPRNAAPEAKRRLNKPSLINEQLESSSNVPQTPSKGTASSSNSKEEQAATIQDSIKKASHVHPKLPDFDTLAAHFSSLRTDSK